MDYDEIEKLKAENISAFLYKKSADAWAFAAFTTKQEAVPELAMEYMRHLSSQIGYCGEVILTAFATYAQVVLKYSCEYDLYKFYDTDRNYQWWVERGYSL